MFFDTDMSQILPERSLQFRFYLPGSRASRIALGAFTALSVPWSAHGVLVGLWTGDAYSAGAWTDSSGGNHLATEVGAPISTTNAFNGHKGVAFDGDDYFTVPNDSSLLIDATAMTLVAVFRPTASNASTGGQFWQKAGLIGNEQPNAVTDWGLGFGGDVAVMGVGQPDTTIASNPLTLNVGYVAIGTWDSSGVMTLYVDGVQVAQNPVSPTAARNANAFPSIALGANVSVFNNDLKPFIGDIAELRIYNDNSQDIAALTTTLTNTYLVPEPGSAILLGLGAVGLISRRRGR